MSRVKACAAIGISRSAFYRPRQPRTDDVPVIEALNELVERHPRWGFWKCYGRMRLSGRPWNHKRVLRVYRQMRLNMPRRTKRRLPRRERQSLDVPAAKNAIWSLDFMSDALYHGRRFRTLNVLDEGVREVLDIVVDTSVPSGRVVRTLEQLRQWRGAPPVLLQARKGFQGGVEGFLVQGPKAFIQEQRVHPDILAGHMGQPKRQR